VAESPKQKQDVPAQADFSVERAFLALELLPDVAGAFSSEIRRLEEAIKDADVVLDTNALLLPYGAGADSLGRIVDVYRKLAQAKRLSIPEQVAREFIRHRPTKIAELYQGIADKLSRFTPPDRLSYPILEGIAEFQALNAAVGKAVELKAEISKANTSLLKHIRNWEWNDPVSKAYKKELASSILTEPACDREPTLAELRRRYDLSIPPGYKDSGKDDYGIGDFLIWKSILFVGASNKRDLIFVSGEEKSDWHHRAGGSAFLPRFELLDEYRRASQGRSLYVIPLSKLLELLDVQEESVNEIREEEDRIFDATSVEVACPHCDAPVVWRLAEQLGSSATPACGVCGLKFHLHRTRTGVTAHKPHDRAEYSSESVDSVIEQVECRNCAATCEASLGVRAGSTAWVGCSECRLSFPVHRRADGTVLVSPRDR
jgi:hypothetical protein